MNACGWIEIDKIVRVFGQMCTVFFEILDHIFESLPWCIHASLPRATLIIMC